MPYAFYSDSIEEMVPFCVKEKVLVAVEEQISCFCHFSVLKKNYILNFQKTNTYSILYLSIFANLRETDILLLEIISYLYEIEIAGHENQRLLH